MRFNHLAPLVVQSEPGDLKCQCTRRAGDGCADYLLLFENNRGGIGLIGQVHRTEEMLQPCLVYLQVMSCSWERERVSECTALKRCCGYV